MPAGTGHLDHEGVRGAVFVARGALTHQHARLGCAPHPEEVGAGNGFCVDETLYHRRHAVRDAGPTVTVHVRPAAKGPLLLGVRHHGPGSARAVRAALDAARGAGHDRGPLTPTERHHLAAIETGLRHDQLLMEHRLRTMRCRLPETRLLARVALCLAVLAGITVLVADRGCLARLDGGMRRRLVGHAHAGCGTAPAMVPPPFRNRMTPDG
ncbi:hypothetical protein [Streptomyces sp. NPDC058623]|uniref:hypothetical protein n=1 Tax=Streptomyces sp. NPDC058623 TaxID=3346563 RepID=UPI003653A80C